MHALVAELKKETDSRVDGNDISVQIDEYWHEYFKY